MPFAPKPIEHEQRVNAKIPTKKGARLCFGSSSISSGVATASAVRVAVTEGFLSLS